MPVVPALMKHVVIPSVGAAAIGGGISATPAILDLAEGKTSRKAMDRILSDGPDVDGNYSIGLGDRILSTITGGSIDQDKIKQYKTKKDFQEIKKDKQLVQDLRDIGVGIDDVKGMDLSGIAARYGKDIAQNKLKGDTQFARELRDSDPNVIAERGRADRAEQYMYYQDAQNQREAEQARLDRRADRQADLEYRMADLSARKQIAQDKYNLEVQKMNREMKNDKKARIAQALAGLGSLGMLFAI